MLNSPWIDLQGSALIHALMPRIVRSVATRAATFILPLPDNGFYARTLDSLRDGTWTFDPELKRNPSQPARSAWLTAVMAGKQHAERTGLRQDAAQVEGTLLQRVQQAGLVQVADGNDVDRLFPPVDQANES